MGFFSSIFGGSKTKQANSTRLKSLGTPESRKQERVVKGLFEGAPKPTHTLDDLTRRHKPFAEVLTESEKKAIEDEFREQEEARQAWETAPDEDVLIRTLGEEPAARPSWIPRASSWVDSYYFEPSRDNPGIGRLFIAFRKGPPEITDRIVEGYYEYIPEEMWDELFTAPSAGEWVRDNLYDSHAYHVTGYSTARGIYLPWPRRGNRASQLPQHSPGRWWSRTGRTEPG